MFYLVYFVRAPDLEDQQRGLFSWDESGGDDDVHFFALLGKKRVFSVDELFGHFLAVASRIASLLLQVKLVTTGFCAQLT